MDDEQPPDGLLDAFNMYSNTRIIRCAAHTVQLGVNDYLQKNREVDTFIKKLNNEAVFWRNLINKRALNFPIPSLSNDTR